MQIKQYMLCAIELTMQSGDMHKMVSYGNQSRSECFTHWYVADRNHLKRNHLAGLISTFLEYME